MMAEQPGAQRQLQGVKQQKAADQHAAADIEGKQHQRGGGDKKGRDARPAPLIGRRGRNHTVTQHQGGNHAEQARVVDMAAVYRENVFGRGGKKRRYGGQPQAVGKIGQHRQAEAGNQAANRNQQGFAPQQIMQQAVQRNANQQNQPDLGRTPVETPKRDAAGNESGLKQQHGQTGIVFGGKAVESNHGKRVGKKGADYSPATYPADYFHTKGRLKNITAHFPARSVFRRPQPFAVSTPACGTSLSNPPGGGITLSGIRLIT